MTVSTTVAPGLAGQIRALLAMAGPATVPSGVLAWWGQTEFPDGADNVPALTQAGWEGAYFLLENAAIERGTVEPLPALEAATRDMRPDGPLPIAIAHFRIAVPRADLARKVRAAAADGGELRFPPQDLADALEERRVFAASALMHAQWGRATPVYRGRTVSFVIDERFHLTNRGAAAPDKVEVDLGDGRGLQPVAVGEPFAATYPTGDTAAVELRCHYGDEALTARFQVAIGDDPAPPAPDETWALQADAVDGKPGNSGRAWVFRAPGRSEIVNPVIVVEGFPGGHPCDYMHELLNQSGTVDALHAAGYDLVIVGLDNGMDEIQRNAGVLTACIREARRRTGQPLVVGGVSMGGLVSRYALAQMETAGEPHSTRAYLSIDAPHGGTYTSLGVQWFVHSLLPFAPALGGFAMLLDSPSNQQLMIAWLHDGAVGESPLRAQLLRDLEAVGGYPREPRKLAVSCGRGDGVGAGQAGARTLAWAGEPFVSATLNTLPGDSDGVVTSGSWFLGEPASLTPLVSDGDLAWETAPGSQNTYNGQVAAVAAGFGCGQVEHELDTTCCVPTVSALDLRQDPFAPVGTEAGPFDAQVCSPDNVQHLAITPEVSKWIVDQLGAPPAAQGHAAPAAPPAWDPSSFDPHDPAFLDDPYATYALFREHAPVFFVKPYASQWYFRYEDSDSILTGTETFLKIPPGGSQPSPGPTGVMSAYPIGIFGSDPPRHARLRSQLEPPFRKAIQQAPDLAAQFAAPPIDAATKTGHMELVSDFALPVPAYVLFSILGIPATPGVWPGLLQWQAAIVRAHDITQPMAVRGAGATCAMALHQFLAGLVREYQQNGGGPGVIGELCTMIGDDLTAEDVHMSCFDFVVAGYLSTTYLIASGIRSLLANPDQLEALRDDPAKMAGAIEELLRFEPPLQLVDRYAAYDTELGGVALKAGDRVTAVIGSADRDPAAFANPDALQIERADAAQMSFGAGIHYCIGAPLVRLAAPVAMAALIKLPGLAAEGLAQWQTDPYLRGLVNLPLRIG